MSSPALRILVPTSERKRDGGSRACTFTEAQGERASNRFPSLSEHRKEAVRALLKALNGQGDAARILGGSGDRIEQDRQRTIAFHRSPLRAAIERESGPLFRALDPAGLEPAATRRMKESVLLVCPLLGVLAPTDLVPLYRCPVGAQTRNGVRSLHHHWKPRVTELLNRITRHKRVFCFLPTRLRALWERSDQRDPVVQFRFAHGTGRAFRHEHAGAGRLAGELLRHVLCAGISDPRQLEGFVSSAGHVFSREHSRMEDGVQVLVFHRP